LRSRSAEKKKMLFYAGPDGGSTFSCLRMHFKCTLNDQAKGSSTARSTESRHQKEEAPPNP
tara:strand:- start:1430 stop:1612 length:183 start_codon:yes stop_codon:yes gene_type:complete